MSGRRRATVGQGANVWPHELKTARSLAAAGRDVEFIRRKEEQRVTSADTVIDGLVWEMKALYAQAIGARRGIAKHLSMVN